MKEITEEIKCTAYEAIDGTKFESKEECAKYEKTAACIIRAKAMQLLVIQGVNAWNFMGGYDEHTISAFRVQSPQDADTIKQFMLIEAPWLNNDSHKELLDLRFTIVDSAIQTKDLILFGLNCDGQYYFINSRLNLLNNLTNLDKGEIKNA